LSRLPQLRCFEIVAHLVKHRATDTLVPNLPDVGITPEIRASGRNAIESARVLTSSIVQRTGG
jgi:phospholipase/lecithinase/hemolysin